MRHCNVPARFVEQSAIPRALISMGLQFSCIGREWQTGFNHSRKSLVDADERIRRMRPSRTCRTMRSCTLLELEA